MRRDRGKTAEEAARERLRSLTGDRDAVGARPPADPAVPRVLAPPGRHARTGPPSAAVALAERVRARLPAPTDVGAGLRLSHLGLIATFLALAILVAWWWAARTAPEPVVMARTSAPALGRASPDVGSGPAEGPVEGPVGGPVPAASGSPAASSAQVVVDVAGKVKRPGVATLPAGSRVIDALRAAGGARAGIDLSSLNLARVLVDGEQILVGVRGSRAAGLAPVPGAGPSVGARVSLSSASQEQLESLPGVGPVTAQSILAWREAHGRFTSVDELLEVDGIGPKTLARIAPQVVP